MGIIPVVAGAIVIYFCIALLLFVTSLLFDESFDDDGSGFE